jgi:ribonuclease P protein component
VPKRFTTLKLKRDFASLSRMGKKRQTSFGVIVCAPGSPDQGVRVAYAVSKKVGNSPERNRIKRRFRVALFHALKDLDIHCDMLLIATPKSIEFDLNQATRELRELFCDKYTK